MKVTKAWVFQVCFGKHYYSRGLQTQNYKDFVAFRSCKYVRKQAGICDQKKKKYIRQLSSDFRVQKKFFPFLWIKFFFHWSQRQTRFDFDKAKISFHTFCRLLICMCVQVYSKFKAISTANLETHGSPGRLSGALSQGLVAGRQGASPPRCIIVNWFWMFLDTFHFDAIFCPSAHP